MMLEVIVRKRTLLSNALVMIMSALLPALPLAAADCPVRIGHWPYGATLAVTLAGDHAVYGVGRTR
jgi:hypothetical protein